LLSYASRLQRELTVQKLAEEFGIGRETLTSTLDKYVIQGELDARRTQINFHVAKGNPYGLQYPHRNAFLIALREVDIPFLPLSADCLFSIVRHQKSPV
jgi:hypothetical protein